MDDKKIKEQLVEDLLKVLEKIRISEVEAKKKIIDDEACIHISYAIEYITGEFGVTREAIEKERPGYFKNKIN